MRAEQSLKSSRFGWIFVSLAVAACVPLALPASASPQSKTSASLRIVKLRGAVTRLGSWGGYALLGVRLKATVCAPVDTYPNEIDITHFAVSGSPRHWWPVRGVVDRARWFVPLDENWHGKPCGKVVLEDAIPPDYYGADSLGNPNGCYGVRLTIKARGSRASKHVIIRCGGIRRS